ncbi:MAG: type II secretion system protein GspG [Planctomycetaceae bacterium]|nr:type II secretion system protein GspG [Planctomycetaceae bacterium]
MQDVRREAGFSLVELLVVIAIIGILATTVTVKVVSALGEARVVRAKAEIAEMKKAIGIYQIKNSGRIPESLEDLKNPTKGDEEGIMPDLGRDPWGNEYEYEVTGTRKFVIRSLGADGQPGGEGQDRDIDSDHLNEDEEGGSGSGGADRSGE